MAPYVIRTYMLAAHDPSSIVDLGAAAALVRIPFPRTSAPKRWHSLMDPGSDDAKRPKVLYRTQKKDSTCCVSERVNIVR